MGQQQNAAMEGDYLIFHRTSTKYAPGEIHPSAIIGHPPELRDWKPGHRCLYTRIHRTARINALCTIDAGTRQHTTIGPRTWLMKNVHVGHDCQIGEDCELAPHVGLGGRVILGDRVKVGINATILPYRTIGSDVTIGAGAVVTKDVPDGWTVAGNPARRLRRRSSVPHTDRADRAMTRRFLSRVRGWASRRAAAMDRPGWLDGFCVGGILVCCVQIIVQVILGVGT